MEVVRSGFLAESLKTFSFSFGSDIKTSPLEIAGIAEYHLLPYVYFTGIRHHYLEEIAGSLRAWLDFVLSLPS